jgi:hypothetical protein
MSLKAFSLALATTALVALNLPAVAEDAKGPNLGATAADAAPGAAATMTLAQDLYALGVQQGDALTVLAAAKLAASVEATEGTAGSLDPATIRFDEEDLLHMKAYPAEAPSFRPCMRRMPVVQRRWSLCPRQLRMMMAHRMPR